MVQTMYIPLPPVSTIFIKIYTEIDSHSGVGTVAVTFISNAGGDVYTLAHNGAGEVTSIAGSGSCNLHFGVAMWSDFLLQNIPSLQMGLHNLHRV
jgi:hypothetical protein